MPILLNKSSEIEDARKMPNSEIEKYIQLAYKRESNRQILRERLIEGKTYREIIERHYFSPVGDWMEEEAERVVRAWTNEIQRMETKFYRVIRQNKRTGGMNMGIYVKDVEMPKNHNHVTITIWSNGAASYGLHDREESIVDFRNVEVVPVPPHGRLIDADAAVANRNADINWCYDLYDLPDYLSGCPTIIPADPEEEEKT